MLADYYDEFETYALKTYFRDKLELENEDYAAIISEYRDGLLIFEVMGKYVWRKAKKDTVGQQEYFKQFQSKYQWKQRVDAEIIGATKEGVIKEVEALLKEGKTGDEIKELLNKDKQVSVLLTKGVYEIGDRELPSKFKANSGISEIFTENNSFLIVKVNKILAPGPKQYEDVKGKVMSDYQNLVEKRWMDELRAKYKVEVNPKTLKKLKKELKS